MNEIVKKDENTLANNVGDVKLHVELLHQVMREIMVKDVHYGTIPGCKKPSLYKAGAELLCTTFKLGPTYNILASESDADKVRYVVECRLHFIPNGNTIGSSIGSCHTGERRFRNQSPAECDNNVLKMAQKRALVSAVLNSTSASDVFTCDMEDTVPEPGKSTVCSSNSNVDTGLPGGGQGADLAVKIQAAKTVDELTKIWEQNKGPLYLYQKRKKELENGS